MKRLFDKNLHRTPAGSAFGCEIEEFMAEMAKKAARRGYDLRDAAQIAYSSVGLPFSWQNAKRNAK